MNNKSKQAILDSLKEQLKTIDYYQFAFSDDPTYQYVAFIDILQREIQNLIERGDYDVH